MSQPDLPRRQFLKLSGTFGAAAGLGLLSPGPTAHATTVPGDPAAGRRGHTPSDLVIRAGGVVFAGDLVWNGLFPNYTHASPTDLGRHVRALRDEGADVWVSGHGTLARADDMARYIDLLDHVEAAARRAIEAGTPLDRAAAEYTVPDGLGEWSMFSDRYPELAFRAWARASTPGPGRG